MAARTAVHVSELVADGKLDSPTGTTIDATNSHSVTPGCPMGEITLRVTVTSAAGGNVTVKAGDAKLAQQTGDLVVAFAQNEVKYLGPFSARYAQLGSALWVDIPAGMTGTIEALHMPRSA